MGEKGATTVGDKDGEGLLKKDKVIVRPMRRFGGEKGDWQRGGEKKSGD